MARELDKIIVIDLESTCWDENDPERLEQGEIIEIGVCTLDPLTFERAETYSYIVTPEHGKISKFCTELTGHTQYRIDVDGYPLEHRIESLRTRYKLKERMWASYGDYDRRQFQRECDAKGIKYPFCATHLNVKNMFAILMGLPREVGMPTAMEMLGLKQLGRHHNGADDAWNIAAILGVLLSKTRLGVKASKEFGEGEVYADHR